MIVSDFLDLVLSKTINRKTIPADIEIYKRIDTALKAVAMDTIPLSLIVNNPDGYTILRTVDSVTFIRKPFSPTTTLSVVDMDDFLMDALALYVLAGIEKEKAQVYMGMYYQEIDKNEKRYIQAELLEATNENNYDNASFRFA